MMQDDMGFLTTGSLVTLSVILGNLIFFLGLPMLVAYYMKLSISAKKTVEETVS